MKERLKRIWEPRQLPAGRAVPAAAAALIFGGALGVFAKWLDNLALDGGVWWHRILGRLDLGNFFSRIAVWLLAALLIAVFARTAWQAALNVFLFFAGMCAAYHLWTLAYSGFDPGSYMLIWYGITLASPVLAVFCWYAKGDGPAAFILSTAVTAVFWLACFAIGIFYIDPLSLPEVLVFLGAAAALYRNWKRTAGSLAAGLALAFLLNPVWPYH